MWVPSESLLKGTLLRGSISPRVPIYPEPETLNPTCYLLEEDFGGYKTDPVRMITEDGYY